MILSQRSIGEKIFSLDNLICKPQNGQECMVKHKNLKLFQVYHPFCLRDYMHYKGMAPVFIARKKMATDTQPLKCPPTVCINPGTDT